MKFTPSKYQQATYDFIQSGSGNAVLNAVAGSGKSTTLVTALNYIPSDQSVLFLAFNKAIVEELYNKTAFLENVEVMTLHSLGARTLRRTLNCRTDGNKYKIRLNEGLKNGQYKPVRELFLEELSQYKSNILSLIDLVRVNLCRSVDDFEGLADKHGLDLIDNEVDVAANVIRWGYQVHDVIDFTDMVYFPVMKKISLQKYDWVFIDECQDLNAAQRELFLKCVKPDTGRFLAVGDPKQAIYGFAGADVESFKLLCGLPETEELPLSVCYRCDQEIINLAKSIVPQIEARDNADPGEVNHEASLHEVKDGDMVICRNVAPLAALCMKYIAEGTKAFIKGRDVGMNLISMIEKTRKEDTDFVLQALNEELHKIAFRMSNKLKTSLSEAKQSGQYRTYEDKVVAIQKLSEGLSTAKEVCQVIREIFEDNNGTGIMLSSIHKSKGLEADRVFILAPERLYNSWAMQFDWMAEQEENIVYVAYTRAKHYLGFITDFYT